MSPAGVPEPARGADVDLDIEGFLLAPAPALRISRPVPASKGECLSTSHARVARMSALCSYIASCASCETHGALLMLASKPYASGSTEVAFHSSLGVQTSLRILLNGFEKTIGMLPDGCSPSSIDWWYSASRVGLWSFNRMPLEPPHSALEAAFLNEVYWPSIVRLAERSDSVMWVGSDQKPRGLQEIESMPHYCKVEQPVFGGDSWAPPLAAICVARGWLWEKLSKLHNNEQTVG